MKLQGTGQQHAFVAQQSKSFIRTDRAGANVSVKQHMAAKIELTSGDRTEQANQTESKGNGAVGLLQEGHFKGVAGIRLRMNFHAEIENMNSAKIGNILEAESDTLTAGIEDQLNGIGEGFDLAGEMEDLFSTFAAAVQDMFGGSEGEQVGPQSIFAGIQDAFSSMFASLQQLTPTVVSDPENVLPEGGNSLAGVGGVEEPAQAAELTEPELDEMVLDQVEESTAASAETATESSAESFNMAAMFSEALSDLQEWFSSQMDAMQTAVDEVSALQPLNEPNGGRGAYNRFYAMYSEMYEMSTSTVSGVTEETGVETEV